jgi:hypothetical protein
MMRNTAKSSETAPTTTTQVNAEQLQERQLELAVNWTGPERLRLLWYWLRLEVQEINYAYRRVIDLQLRLPDDWATLGRDPRVGGRVQNAKRSAEQPGQAPV